MFGEDRGNGDSAGDHESARLAQAVLVQHGIVADPSLVEAPQETRARLRLTRRYAVQGALLVAGPATLAAFIGLWIYGVVVAGATGLGVALVALRFEWLDRVVPSGVPRGRTLGGLVAAALAIVVALPVILPVRAARVKEGGSSAAAGLLTGVYQAIAAGHVSDAQQLFERAAASDPHATGLADARARLTVAHVQELLDEQARREGVFDEAERAFRRGSVKRAIRLMSSIKGFRNADQRLAAYRTAGHRPRSRPRR